jgi:hypothetical protein
MVNPVTSSPGNRIAYMRRATANRSGTRVTRKAWRISRPAPRLGPRPAAYIRTPRSPTQRIAVPELASRVTAA